jgi:hypothetical protein
MIVELCLSQFETYYENCRESEIDDPLIPTECDIDVMSLDDYIEQIKCICEMKTCLYAEEFFFEEACEEILESDLNPFLIDDNGRAQDFFTQINRNKSFQNLAKIDETSSVNNSNLIYLLDSTENGIEFYDSGVSGRCLYETALFMENIVLWIFKMKDIKYAINISSIIASILIVLLITSKKTLRRTLHGQFLICIAITTILNYSMFAFITTDFYESLSIMYKGVILRSYMCLELAIYLWINIVCYHVFTTIM